MSNAVLCHIGTDGKPVALLAENDLLISANYVWDPIGLAWVRQTQSGGGGGGDASAANQLTEINRLEAIRDRLPAALVGGRLDVNIGAGFTLGLTDAQLRASAVPVDLSDEDTRIVGRVKIHDGTDVALVTGAGALQVDGSGATQPVSGTVNIGTFPDNEPFNVAQFGGSVVVTGTGAGGAGIPRVTLSSDSSLAANQSVNCAQMNGVAVTMGNGASGTGVQRVTIASDSTGVIAVTQATAASLNAQVQGAAAHAAPASGNPVYIAGRASAAIPTDVGADGDAAAFWTNRNGAQVVSKAPHVGLNSDPWNLVHEAVQHTTTQTSTVLVAGGASEKIVVTKIQIQVFGTNAGDLIVYFGTGAYVRGTNRAVFDGTFKPSATLAPGVVMDGPFIAGANGDDLMVTTTNNLSVTISVWYYVVT